MNLREHALTRMDREGKIQRIYEKGKRTAGWELEVEWERIGSESLPPTLDEAGYKLSCMSSHVEQVGMRTAALLLQSCSFYPLKLALAQAVMDEARHAEVFTNYAYRARGDVPLNGSDANELTDHFFALESFELVFLSHVFLENLALEQFACFIEMFDGFLLGDLYRNAQSDEARHVTLGLAYFEALCAAEPSFKRKLLEHLEDHHDVLGTGEDGVAWLADLTGQSADAVRKRMQRREASFVSKIEGIA